MVAVVSPDRDDMYVCSTHASVHVLRVNVELDPVPMLGDQNKEIPRPWLLRGAHQIFFLQNVIYIIFCIRPSLSPISMSMVALSQHYEWEDPEIISRGGPCRVIMKMVQPHKGTILKEDLDTSL